MNRWLLNFDVRVAKDHYVNDRWDEETRAKVLVRRDVDWPLSVDRWVWPSVFFTSGVKDARDAYATIAVDSSVEGVGYWRDLSRMRAHYNAHASAAPNGVFIAIELVSEKSDVGGYVPYELPGGISCGIPLDPVVPDRIPIEGSFLGFDVATDGRSSGLTGFEYSDPAVADLATPWASRLNAAGLLSELDDAIAFRQLSDERLAQEAPFWIYGLWRLPDE